MLTPEEWTVIGLICAAPLSAAWLWRRDMVRPGSLRRLAAAGRVRHAAALHPGVWLVSGLLTFLAAGVGAGAAAGAMGVAPGASAGGSQQVWVGLAGYSLALVVGFACLALMRRTGARLGVGAESLGLRARGRDVAIGLGALAVALPLCIATGVAAGWIGEMVTGEPPPEIAHSMLKEIVEERGQWQAWAKVAMAAVGAPVMEELVYRVFLQSALLAGLARLRGMRPPHGEPAFASAADALWAILIATAVFVAPHAAALDGPADWQALPTLAVLGLALGLAYERTRSPVVPIVMHAGFNGVNIVAALVLA